MSASLGWSCLSIEERRTARRLAVQAAGRLVVCVLVLGLLVAWVLGC
eukprot:COSAG02_NODE_4892_length_4859_cov_1.859874_2_plen_47_part_00